MDHLHSGGKNEQMGHIRSMDSSRSLVMPILDCCSRNSGLAIRERNIEIMILWLNHPHSYQKKRGEYNIGGANWIVNKLKNKYPNLTRSAVLGVQWRYFKVLSVKHGINVYKGPYKPRTDY